jgi:hypothetical protein
MRIILGAVSGIDGKLPIESSGAEIGAASGVEIGAASGAEPGKPPSPRFTLSP